MTNYVDFFGEKYPKGTKQWTILDYQRIKSEHIEKAITKLAGESEDAKKLLEKCRIIYDAYSDKSEQYEAYSDIIHTLTTSGRYDILHETLMIATNGKGGTLI